MSFYSLCKKYSSKRVVFIYFLKWNSEVMRAQGGMKSIWIIFDAFTVH